MQQIPMTLEHARQQGELGMYRAAVRAENEHRDWIERALAALLKYIQTLPHTAEFIIEDVRLAIEGQVPIPSNLRSWGPVTKAAIKRFYIIDTGRMSPAKSSHASKKPLYRRGGSV